MPEGFDERTGRLYHIEPRIAKGLNLAAGPRALSEGESPYVMGVHFRQGIVVPGKMEAPSPDYTGLTEVIHHCGRLNTGITRFLIMLGTTKAWALKTDDTFQDITPTQPFETPDVAERWECRELVNGSTHVVVVNNDGYDAPHYWDGAPAGKLVPVTTQHLARTIIGYQNCLYMGNVYEVPATEWYVNRLRWSCEADITDWTGLTAGYYDLMNEGDPIKRLGLVRGNYLLVFREGSVYVVYPTGDPYDPIGDYGIHSTKGIWAPNSLQRIGEGYFYLGNDDVYYCDVSTPFEGVGASVRDELYSQTDPLLLPWAWSFYDERAKDYYLVTKMKDATTHAWVYNTEEKNWGRQDFSSYTALGTWYEHV